MLNEAFAKGYCSKRAIERILHRKKRWIDLQEDLLSIKTKMEEVNNWMVKLPHERKNLGYLCDMLVLQHQYSYYKFLYSLEYITKIYRVNQNDEYFNKCMEVRAAAVHEQPGVILNLRNGYYVTQAGVSPTHISLEASDYDEFLYFHQAFTPIIDEMELIPKKVRLLKRCYG